MTWVDGAIIVGAVIGAVIGFRQGLILSIFAFIGLVVGVALAGVASDTLAEGALSNAAAWVHVVIFIFIMFMVMVIFNILGQAVKNSIKSMMLSWADSVGGALLGLFMGGLLVAAVFIVIANWVVGETGESSLGTAISDSALAHFLIDSFQFLLALLPDRFDSVRDLFN
jgi:uncharacterized membrane protein required for colicin V production